MLTALQKLWLFSRLFFGPESRLFRGAKDRFLWQRASPDLNYVNDHRIGPGLSNLLPLFSHGKSDLKKSNGDWPVIVSELQHQGHNRPPHYFRSCFALMNIDVWVRGWSNWSPSAGNLEQTVIVLVLLVVMYLDEHHIKAAPDEPEGHWLNHLQTALECLMVDWPPPCCACLGREAACWVRGYLENPVIDEPTPFLNVTI